ncbi:hypothetical protein [Bradyrhizobium sp.]|uniref:hypothetical protein n=1 Tax=Bradyrhizobium sp. TaxID=376 RepID=UPI000A684A3A|nr:hypothetical protein [Bradyrhizobium sp.]
MSTDRVVRPGGENLDLLASAILLWLPEGEEPDVQLFSPDVVVPPPHPHPDPWWLLHEAITAAMEVTRSHQKLPWIKVGTRILSPQEISETYRNMGDLKASFGSRPPTVKG